jgi:hypothetical protein
MVCKPAVYLKSQFVISSWGDSHCAVRLAVLPAPTVESGLPLLTYAAKLKGVEYGG